MKLIFVKRNLFIVLAAIVVAGVCLGAGISAAATNAAAPAAKTVVIDAGHGGVDAGVIGVATGIKESDINLSIAKKLKGYFAAAGFEVVMTRTGNGGLYGTATKGFKMRDMKKRKEIIEECAADMVISVHQNFCPIPARRGGIAFFDGSSECGKALAQSIQSALNDMDGVAEKHEALVGDYYMLKCTQNPSVIVECGFLSNSEDDKLLTTEEYQKAVAFAIFKGAVGYYS